MTMETLHFDAVKRESLRKLAIAVDKSPKGSVDAPIVDFVAQINAHPDYVTSSSCSGRIAVFCAAGSMLKSKNQGEDSDEKQEAEAAATSAVHLISKGGTWLLSEHATVTMTQVVKALQLDEDANEREKTRSGMVVFKHEPFILHVVCRNVDAARALLQVGLASGFRESGIVLGARKVMCAIRTTSGAMEIPLAASIGEIRGVERTYLEWIVAIANERFAANATKTAQFAAACKDTLWSKVETEMTPAVTVCSTTRSKKAATLTVQDCTKMEVTDENCRLLRTGHSSVAFDGKIYVFGGQGQTASGTQSRLADLVEIEVDVELGSDKEQLKCVAIEAVEAPSPRMHHSAVAIGGKMIVFGGRAGPCSSFNDVHAFDFVARTWRAYEIEDVGAPMPRWKHACCAIGNTMYVYGGRDNTRVFADLYALDFSRTPLAWTRIDTEENEIPRYDHIGTVVETSKLLFWGGQDSLDEISMVDSSEHCLVFDTQQQQWSRQQIAHAHNGPGPDTVGASACTVSDSHVVICGGISSRTPVGSDATSINRIFVLSTATMEWKPAVANEASDGGWVNATCTCLQVSGQPPKLVILGGGYQCFGFGFVYLPPFIGTLQLSSLGHQKQTMSAPAHPIDRKQAIDTSLITAQLGVLASKAQVKQIKTLLESCQVYDKTRRIHVVPEHQGEASTTFFLVPVTSLIFEAQSANDSLQNLQVVDDQDAFANKFGKGAGSNRNDVVYAAIRAFAKAHHVPEALQATIPQRYEFVGDVLMVPRDSFTDQAWTSVSQWLWSSVCRQTTPRLSRVARKAFVDAGEMRQSHVELVFVDESALATSSRREQPGWVQVRENGITYGWDLTKVMFSSGNVTEKARMGRMPCQGETIVDLYAGIGYYVLPFLVHGNAAYVHACEWNPNSIDALRFNLERNRVADRCTIYPGDNQLSAPTIGAIADRVNLGLLPTSERAWPLAVQVLKPDGGVLHIHDNVAVHEREQWEKRVVASITQLAVAHGRSWRVTCEHVETVKSYAPKVFHLVMDLRCVRVDMDPAL